MLALTLATGGTAPALAPAHFTSGHGWHAGATRVHSCPGVPRSRCEQVESWASTVRFRDCGNCLPPRKTLVELPKAGVVIQLILGREATAKHRRALAWPPVILSRDVVGPIEGGPERIGSVQRFGVVHGLNAYLYLFFGRRHPTASQLARVNAELRTTRLP